jgi:lipopolysaccharide/colanic/teichoic acid biosynthesis glycosyltransferase
MARFSLYPVAKRLLDITVASLALVVLSPLLVLIAILIKIDSPGPVLFRQKRLGRGGIPFTMYKFRTMKHNATVVRNPDGSYFVGANDPRLTRIGRFLREFTLDEIPQLINVLKGDMSLVGPRPDQVADLELYDDLLKRKLEVKPGMANLALIHGRNLLSWRQRAEWDAYYVDHRSLRLDLEILLKTAVLVLLRKGVYYPEDYPDQVRN